VDKRAGRLVAVARVNLVRASSENTNDASGPRRTAPRCRPRVFTPRPTVQPDTWV